MTEVDLDEILSGRSVPAEGEPAIPDLYERLENVFPQDSKFVTAMWPKGKTDGQWRVHVLAKIGYKALVWIVMVSANASIDSPSGGANPELVRDATVVLAGTTSGAMVVLPWGELDFEDDEAEVLTGESREHFPTP